MIKNYIIGLLAGYIIVELPIWSFDSYLQPLMVVLMVTFYTAWMIRIIEDNILLPHSEGDTYEE